MKAQERAENFKKKLGDSEDIIIKEIMLQKAAAHLVFIDTITDANLINQNILFSLSHFEKESKLTAQNIMSKLSSINKVKLLEAEQDMITDALKGNALLFVDDIEEVIGFAVTRFESRSIMEPPTSSVIKGPREGFTESIITNIGLIRKRLQSPELKIENFNVGTRTLTSVRMVYFGDIADKEVIDEVRSRISEIEIDGVIDSHYISEYLEQRPFSMFKQIGTSEKPDIISAKLLEGRVAIFVDGSPIVLTVPFLIFEDVQSANDYYTEPYRAGTIRILRLVGAFMSVLLPGLYLSLVLYHYKLLPLRFLVTVVNSTANLPLNPILEVFLILILFEILFEASVRMPKYLGIAISIVGALILGDTAVRAGLVSPPTVMIVAISGITIYLIPDQSSQMSLLRVLFVLIGGLLGFLGILLGAIVVVAYLCSFDNYKTPYLAPYVPMIEGDRKDWILKKDQLFMTGRPRSFPQHNKTRTRNK
jgi:spore germination protein KA